MCKYRYEFFSYCGHQTFYLFDYCENANIRVGETPNSSTTAYSDLSEDLFEQDNYSDQLSSEEVDSPRIPNRLPSPGRSVASVLYSTDTQEMSPKNKESSVSSKVLKDSARILETCYKALEQSNSNESRRQSSMEGSPGFRSISRHAFEERLRFFESAVASPNTDVSDTLSRFTYDSNTDTLYSLDLQLKRILEKIHFFDHASPEKSAGALNDISNGSPRLNIAKTHDKGDGGRGKTLHGTATFSSYRKDIDTAAAKKANSGLARLDTSNLTSKEKETFSSMPHDTAHGVIRNPKAMETRNTRKALPVQWLSGSKKTSYHDFRQPIKSQPSSPTKRNEEKILHSPSRKEVSNTAINYQTNKNLALSSKADRPHAPSSPIASKAPNLRTAERAAVRGLKRGQMEMSPVSSPRNSRTVIKSQGRRVRDSPLSPLAVECGSPSSPRMHVENNIYVKEKQKSIKSSNWNNEENDFTFSSTFSYIPPIQSEHHRRKSSITSTSSTNPVFYSAPQSPSKPQAMNVTDGSNRSSGVSFDFSRNAKMATSTDCQQRRFFTGNRNVDSNGDDSVRDILQGQGPPRKRPKLRLQTSLIQLHAMSETLSDQSAALPEGSAVDSVLGTKEVQNPTELAQTEDAHEISSCTAELASSITLDAINSWQSCPMTKDGIEPDATKQVELISIDTRELSFGDYGQRKIPQNIFANAASFEKNSSLSKDDEEKNSPKTLQADIRRLSREEPLIRDSIRYLNKKREDYLFINPAIIIWPKDAENKREENIVVEVQEVSDVEGEIECQLSKETASVIENREDLTGYKESKKLWKQSDMDRMEHIAPDMHASFASRLKATAPDFVPQSFNASKAFEKASEAQERANGALRKVEPFAHQMDLLSAQLQQQAINPDYALYNPVFGGLSQFNPFYMPFLTTYEPPIGVGRHWHKNNDKNKHKKANKGRTQQCQSPVPSIGAFRDDKDASQWLSGDSSVGEQLDLGVYGISMSQMGDSNARYEDEECNLKTPGLGFESFTTPKNQAVQGFADKMNEFAVTVEPCDEIIVEKASEHVGGLPCRTCYPDHPA